MNAEVVRLGDAVVEVRIREMRDGDLDALVEIAARCNEQMRSWAPDEWTPPEPESERPGWLPKRDIDAEFRYVACDRTGRVLGGVTAQVHGDEGHVGRLFVDPAEQGRGVGKALLDLIEGDLTQAGAARLTLGTPVGSPAVRFYEAHGWVSAGPAEPHPRLGVEMTAYTKQRSGP